MYCTKCGSQNPDDASFCAKCGSPMHAATPPPDATYDFNTGKFVGHDASKTPAASAPAHVWKPNPETTPRQKSSPVFWLILLLVFGLFGYLLYQINTNPIYSLKSDVSSSDQSDNQPPAESHQQTKQEFLQDVDESISGARISGNPYKFVGDKVDLHGTVVNVLDDSHFNMTTGDIYSDNYAIILVETNPGNATDLEAKQAVRVIGTVEEPTSGTNAMGGQGEFATVKAEFIE